MKPRDAIIGLVIALLVAGVLYRFSSDLPDSFEYVLEMFNNSTEPETGKAPGLIFGLSHKVLALVGVIVMFGLGMGLGKVFSIFGEKEEK